MSTIQKQGSRDNFSRSKQRRKRARLWLICIPAALIALLLTRLDVKSALPPAELFKTAPVQNTEPVSSDEPHENTPGTEHGSETSETDDLNTEPGSETEASSGEGDANNTGANTSDSEQNSDNAESNGSDIAESDKLLGINSRGGTERVERYADISISESEVYELACVVFMEANTQSLRGQQAVAEVIFNRVIADNFPSSVHDVIYEGTEGTSQLQLSTAPFIGEATPNENQYLAIELALYGPSVLPDNVVFFSIEGENEHIWGSIDDHVFCYQYPWAEN